MNKEKIIEENHKDIEKGKNEGYPEAFVDRLTLNEARIQSMAEAVLSIAESPKVLGEIVSEFKRDDGLIDSKRENSYRCYCHDL